MTNINLLCLYYVTILELIMLILFSVIHVTHFRLFRVKTILRTTLLHGVVSSFIGIAVFHILIPVTNGIPIIALYILSFIIFCLAIFAYGSMGPIMADRSLSVFLLILLHKNNKDITKDYIYEKLGGKDVFLKRFDEHEDVNAIYQDGDVLHITPKGERIAKIYLLMINILKLKKNYEL